MKIHVVTENEEEVLKATRKTTARQAGGYVVHKSA